LNALWLLYRWVQVTNDFVEDSFNLVGLRKCVKDYDNCLRLICDYETGTAAAPRPG